MIIVVDGAHHVIHSVLRKDIVASILCEACTPGASVVNVLKSLGRIECKFVRTDPNYGPVALMKVRDVQVCMTT